MLSLPPKAGPFLLGTLAGLVLALVLGPQYHSIYDDTRPLPFLSDDLSLTGPLDHGLNVDLGVVVGQGEAIVEPGGPYGGAQREDGELGSSGQGSSMGSSTRFLQGQVGDPLFGEERRGHLRTRPLPHELMT